MLSGEIHLPQMPRMRPVLRRLERHMVEVATGESGEIKTREAKIRRMMKGVRSFASEWEASSDSHYAQKAAIISAKHAFEAAEEQFKARNSDKRSQREFDEAQEAYQVALTGFLFAKNKELFVASKGIGSFDARKEARQMEGVLRTLNETAGQHLHIGTGEGKSTVILPIAALVSAATGEDGGRVVVGSANGTLVGELRHNTIRLARELIALKGGKHDRQVFEAMRVQNVSVDSAQPYAEEDLSAQITSDVLLHGTISEDTKQKQKELYWKRSLQERERDGLLVPRPQSEKRSLELYFAQEKDLVFKWMDSPAEFEAQCPKILMDEAHVAYDRGTPYAKTSLSEAIGAQEVKAGVSNWLIHYIIAQEIGVEDVMAAGGDYILTEEGREKINRINVYDIAPASELSYSRSFYAGVDVITKSLGITLTHAERRKLQLRLLAEMKTFMPHDDRNHSPLPGVPPQEGGHQQGRDFIQSIGGEIARFVRLKDKIFTQQEGGLVIRDSYIDELLAEHKYHPAAQSAVLAITGIFEPIKRNVAFKTMTYPSFVNAIGDRLVALSGTLMHPDPEQGTMQEGRFARFLKKVTGREACAIATPEIKPLPKPHLFETTEEMRNALLADLRWERGFDQQEGRSEGRDWFRPTLMVDFNGLESAMATFDKMKQEYGADNVRLLLSKPTGGSIAAEQEYERKLNEYRRLLAEGKIQVLVSSGSAALGVNFEKRDGAFPDMRTVILGLPDSKERIFQLTGRRREPERGGRNHLWYLTMADLELPVSLLEKQEKRIYISLERSQQQMYADILAAKGNPDRLLPLIGKIMHKHDMDRAQDEAYAIRYDELMDREVVPFAMKHLERRIATEILGYDTQTYERLIKPTSPDNNEEESDGADEAKKAILAVYMQIFGLPSTIHEDARRASMPYYLENKSQSALAMSPPHQFEEQMRLLRQGIFGKTPTAFNIEQYVDDWFEESRKCATEFFKTAQIAQVIEQLSHVQGKEWTHVAYIKGDLGVEAQKALFEDSTLISGVPMSNGAVLEMWRLNGEDPQTINTFFCEKTPTGRKLLFEPNGRVLTNIPEGVKAPTVIEFPTHFELPSADPTGGLALFGANLLFFQTKKEGEA